MNELVGELIASAIIIVIGLVFIFSPIIVILLISREAAKNKYRRLNPPNVHANEPKPYTSPQQPQVQQEIFPYVLSNSILTYKESMFFQTLIPITAKFGLNVFTKMRVADLVYVPKHHPEYMKWFNYIRSKHIDFIICRELRPVLLIEVDDGTHDRISNKKRDDFKDKVFHQLGLPLLRVRRWQSDELEMQIANILGIKEKAGL